MPLFAIFSKKAAGNAKKSGQGRVPRFFCAALDKAGEKRYNESTKSQ